VQFVGLRVMFNCVLTL